MSVRINASGEYLRRTANLPSSTSFTMCGWAKHTRRAGQFQFWGLENATSNSSAWLLMGYSDVGEQLTIAVDAGPEGNFASSPTAEEWFFWALTCSGTGGSSFNGYWGHITTPTLITVSAIGSSFTPAMMSLGNDSWDEFMNQAHGPTYVYDAVLTAAELERQRHQILPVRFADLNLWSPHFAGATERLADYSGNGRNWTAGGTLTDEDNPPVSWGAPMWVLPLVVESAGGDVEGSANLTLGALTVAASGDLDIAGAAAITLGALTAVAEGDVAIDGDASMTLGALTTTAAGTVAIKGESALTLGVLTASATGTALLTLYASPAVADGSGNSGLTTGDAVSLGDAVDLCVPGTTVVLMDGTFELSSSLAITLQGTEDAWIKFQPENPGSTFIEWTGVTNDPMFYLLSATGEHCCFIEINGLIFDGADTATNAIFCQKPSGVTGFHPFAIRIINNEIRNVGSSGIATIQADYIHVIGNKIHHVGMVRGWGSGISLNTNIWADEEPTFHNLILNNTISGVYDCCGSNREDDPGDDTDITDGNGIIYDRSLDGNSSPPVLIANNVIYMCGGRGILTFMAGNAWIINNTCYQNGLDLLLGNDGSGVPDIGDIQIGGTSANNYVFNNIVHAWTIRHAFALMASSDALWRRNLWYGGDDLYGIDPGDAADNNQFLYGNPVFTDPPAVDPDDGGQYLLADDPDDLTTEFHLQASSPAVDYGIDPRTVTGQKIILADTSEVTDLTALFAQMTEYLLTDAAGTARDSGGDKWDLGAYESPYEAGGIALLMLGALTLTATGIAEQPDIPLSTGLVSYWSLDEASGTRVDSHGSNDLTDNATVGSTTGKISTAADFEAGNSEFLSLTSNSDVQTGDIGFTFAAWVNIESAAGSRAIVSKWDNATNSREYLLDYNTVNNRFRFLVSQNGTSFTTVSADNFGAASTATWYYVVAWHDASADTINIQVNNGTPNSAAHSTGVNVDDTQFRIGAAVANGGVPAYFDGLIDEVAFWKRVLTTAERTDLYNSGDGRDYAYILSTAAIEGTASITLGALTVAAAGTVDIAGAASLTLDALTVTATGTVESEAIEGSASMTLGALTVAARGYILTNANVNGVLTVSSNGRYFENDNGPLVLAGMHTWYDVQDGGPSDPPPVFDWDEFLAALVSYGHNCTKLWRLETARHWGGFDDQIFTHHAYPRTGGSNAADGKPQFDLDAWNDEYFTRLRERAIEAGNAGIYVIVQLFQGWHIDDKGAAEGDPWAYHPFEGGNNSNSVDADGNSDGNGYEMRDTSETALYNRSLAFVDKMIATLGDLDHVIWEVSNEDTYSNETLAWQRAIAAYLKEEDARNHPVGITKLWPNGDNSNLFGSDDADWISIDDDWPVPTPDQADGSKVILYDTDHIFGVGDQFQWVLQSFAMGNNPLYMDEWDGALYGSDTREDADYVLIRRLMGDAVAYSQRMDLLNTTPQPSLSTTGWCLAKTTGDAHLFVYQDSTGAFDVDLTGISGAFNVEWYRVSNGETQAGSSVNGGAERTLTPPWSGAVAAFLTQGNSGTASLTLGVLTVTSTGAVTIAGSATMTLDALTATSAGEVALTGAASITLGALVASAAGEVAIEGAATLALGALTVAASGVIGEVTTGQAAIILGALTANGAGAVEVAGQASIVLGALVANGAGELPIAGQASLVLGVVTLDSMGTVAILGAATLNLGALTVVATGALDLDIPTVAVTIFGPTATSVVYGPETEVILA